MKYPYGKQEILAEDIEAVVEVLKSEFITQGQAIVQFEQALNRICGAKYATAVNSATAALHIACLSLGVGKGDTVWTSPNSFVASANCALYCGAKIDFVDIDAETKCISITKLTEKLEQAKKTQALPKVLIPVHFAGQSSEMYEIKQLSRQYGFHIIEDASHALGGRYKTFPVGSCKYSDITVFSFHPVKIITTGEGGAALTNEITLKNKMDQLRSHGITKNQSEFVKKNYGPWTYEQHNLGFNYRITDFQCALGISQLSRLSQIVERRNEIARKYIKKLSQVVKLPVVRPDIYSSFHLFCISMASKTQRSEVFHKLRDKSIGVNLHYIPIHTQPFFEKRGFKFGQFPIAERHADLSISLPIHSTITDEDVEYISETLKDAIK